MPRPGVRIPSLSAKESLILEILIAAKEMYGLELVDTSAGALKRGTIYVTRGPVEDKGYVTSRLEEFPTGVGGPSRRLYAPTRLGREVLSVWTTAANRFRVRFALSRLPP